MSDKPKLPLPATYQVGYRKPPAQTRFKPGQSGNPKGRPRRPIQTAEALHTIMNEKVVANLGGKKRRITKLEAILRMRFASALAGNIKAADRLLDAYNPTDYSVISDKPEFKKKLDLSQVSPQARQELRNAVLKQNPSLDPQSYGIGNPSKKTSALSPKTLAPDDPAFGNGAVKARSNFNLD